MSDLLKVKVGGSNYLCKWEEPSNVVEIGGRKYKTVKIGSQEWLAENLDYKFRGCDIGPTGAPSTPAAWYYNNDEETYGVNGNKYGLLYNWYAVDFLNQHLSGLGIPAGWRVPAYEDSLKLYDFLQGDAVVLKSTTGWEDDGNGTDDFGFSAYPVGQYTNNDFSSIGFSVAYRLYDTDSAIHLYSDFNGMDIDYVPDEDGHPIRLVKDAT